VKVMEITTKKVVEVNDSYGHRLIEQGRAVPAKEEKSEEQADKGAKAKRAAKE